MSAGALDRQDILISVCLHGVLLLVALVSTPQLRQTPMISEPLPVEIVSLSELTSLTRKKEPVKQEPVPEKQPVKAPVLEPKPAPPKVVKQEAAPMPVEKRPEPIAEPKKEDRKVPEEPMPAPPKTELVTPVPPKEETPPKPILDLSQVQALLDKTPDDPVAPKEDMEEAEEITISEIDLFKAQFIKCWSFPAGAKNGENLRVEVVVSMSVDGMVVAGPTVVNREKLGDPYFRAAAESVLRAIRRCQPFKLPAEKYKGWREIKFGFDPLQMLGG